MTVVRIGGPRCTLGGRVLVVVGLRGARRVEQRRLVRRRNFRLRQLIEVGTRRRSVANRCRVRVKTRIYQENDSHVPVAPASRSPHRLPGCLVCRFSSELSDDVRSFLLVD